MAHSDLIAQIFAENLALHRDSQASLSPKIARAAEQMIQCVRTQGTLFWAGNGGSAADAQHMAAELIGRFKKERKPIKSISLTCNTSTITALGNDYSYDLVFCRELEAFGRKGDVLMAISTSGNSKNILAASQLAQKLGIFVIALTGETGGELAKHSDLLMNVPSNNTARVQEILLMVEHMLCEAVENSVTT